MSRRITATAIVFSLIGSIFTASAFANEHCAEALEGQAKHHSKHAAHKSHAPEVKHSIHVKAKPEQVWAAIQHQRENDSHRKLLSYDGNAATLHETFAALPIVGEASCDYVEHESDQYKRIDYNLVKSDRFAVFEGSWVISPDKDGTTVELTNAIDPGIRVPFWQDITKIAASKMVKRRLDAVNAYASQLNHTQAAQ